MGRYSSYALLVPGLVLSVIFLLFPIAIIFVMSLYTTERGGGYLPVLTIDNYVAFFTSASSYTILLNTFEFAAVAALICFFFGFPLSYVLTFRIRSVRFKNYLITLLIVPFLIDWSIRTVAWYAILGNSGIVNFALMSLGITKEPVQALLFTRNTLYVIWLQTYVVFMLFPIYLAMNRIDPDLISAARVLKAPPHHVLYDIVFKLSLPGIITGFVFVVVSTLGDYVTPNLWAGGAQTLGYSIARYGVDFLWPGAAAMSTVLLIVVLVLVYIAFRIVNIKKLVYE